MRHVLVLVLIINVFSIEFVLAQDSPVEQAHVANLLAENGDVAAAIAIYEALLDDNIRDSTIFTNLGHLYFADQEPGKALLNYRRAQQVAPRDSEVSRQIARIRSFRTDIQGDDVILIDSLTALTSSILTLSELGWLALGLWLMLFVGINTLIIKANWRNHLRGPVLVLLILTISIVCLWGSRAYVERFRPGAVVLIADIAVRSGPDADYLAIYELHAATEMRQLEVQGDWVRFVLPDGRQGWIERAAIETI